MKIIRCRIDGFGKFSNAEFTFRDGMNCLCFGNGWGKTTLAAFIRAMLYGLRSERTNARELSDRALYRPFAGGAFGGSMEIAAGNDVYLIRRTFDAHRESRDTADVYLNGRRDGALSEDFAGRILGLDEQSFVRTLFAGSGDMEVGSTGGIEARLNDYTQGEIGADEAIKRLDGERKKLLPDRGNGGAINAQRAAAEKIRTDIYAAEQQKARLDELYARRKKLQDEAQALEGELARAGDAERAGERRLTRERFAADAGKNRAEAAKIAEGYPKGLPDEREIAKVRQMIADMNASARISGGNGRNDDAKRRRGGAVIFALCPAILLIAAAIYLLCAGMTTAGAICLSASALIFAVCAIIAVGRRGGKKNTQSDGIYAAINAFFVGRTPYAEGAFEERLNAVDDDLREYEKLSGIAAELERRAQATDGEVKAADAGATRQLIVRLAKLNSDVSATEDEIEECERVVAALPERYAALDRANAASEEYELRRQALVCAAEHIKLADAELKGRFSLPLAKAYSALLERTGGLEGEGAALGADMSVTLTRDGITRGDEHLSTGQRAISALCFRLALSDCLFRGEKPFIILDDPFAHLDERRIADCGRALAALAADRQIIYFTCHPSRSFR